MAENWLAVIGYEGSYEVSDCGGVRSLGRTTTHGRRIKGKRLKPLRHYGGYLTVNLSRGNKNTSKLIHRLVLDAFVGACPLGWQACHNDGKKRNNWLGNLRWDTLSANQRDRYEHKTMRHAKPVIRDDGLEFGSAREAARCLGLYINGIYPAIWYGRKCGGHRWRYV